MVCAHRQVFKHLQSIPSPQQYRCTQGDFKIIKPNSLLKKTKEHFGFALHYTCYSEYKRQIK